MKNIIVNVEYQTQNVNNISFLNERINKKNKSKFETIFETLHQQSSIELNKIIIRNSINFKCSNLKHHENDIILRQFWKRT